MKKLILFLFLFLSLFCFAGDSTAIGVDAGADFFGFLFSFIPDELKSTIITVLTGLFLLEQWLAKTSLLAANSTFQLIGSWIRSIYSGLVKK